MNHARGYGIATPHYYTGIALVLLYDNPADEQSKEIQKLIAELGVKGAYEKISGVKADSFDAGEIEKEYIRLKEKYGI